MSNHLSSIRAFFIFRVFRQYIFVKETTGDDWKKENCRHPKREKGRASN
jgi:hypothetical protein